MKKIVVATSLIILCAITSAAQSARVIKKQANIRARPSNTAKIVMKVNVNTVVKLESLDHTNGWYYISQNKAKGWIYGDTIKIIDEFADFVNGGRTKDYSKIYEDDWIQYGSSVDGSEWYNPAKMKRRGSIVSVWTKTVDKTTYRTTAMILAEIDCHLSRTRSFTGVTYYPSGGVKSSWDSKDIWSTIIPDTLRETLQGIICKL